MRCHLIAVGKASKGTPERALFETYAGRLVPPFSLDLREVEEKKRVSGAELKKREADLLLGAVPDGAVVVALDERGKALSSRDFATRIEVWRDAGARDVAFLIGGADGLGDAVRARADLVLNLGRLTWPHMLVRALVAEQVFRAQCILSNHPYHRD
jgi:23S rRNA (pseudouridine1915-N3)-methyltransferase